MRDDERLEVKGHKASRRNTLILQARETAFGNLHTAEATGIDITLRLGRSDATEAFLGLGVPRQSLS